MISGGYKIVCDNLERYKWKWNKDTYVMCEFRSIEPVYYKATNICIHDEINIFDYFENVEEYKTVNIDFRPSIDLAFENENKITLIEIKLSSNMNI